MLLFYFIDFNIEHKVQIKCKFWLNYYVSQINICANS
jgi:hypothetical protein